jgi:hypothetical protein
MSAAPAVLQAPAMPQVNLLPPDVRHARTLGVVKRWTAAWIGVTVFAVGTAAGVARLIEQDAAAQLAQADAETAGLVAQQRPFVEVTRVRAELRTLEEARRYGLAQEILWADQLTHIMAATPDGVAIGELTYSGATPITAAPASADPLILDSAGTITFTAVSVGVVDTADWADALEAVPGYRDVRVTTLARHVIDDGYEYQFSGTIQVDDGALAHRFDAATEGES